MSGKNGFTIDGNLLSISNALKAVAIFFGACAAYGAFATAPKMASPAGMPINDLLNTLIPGIGAVVAWIWSNWSKVSPEMVAAVVSLARNPGDATAWLRVTAGLALFLKQVRPNSKALNTLVQFSRELHDELLAPEEADKG